MYIRVAQIIIYNLYNKYITMLNWLLIELPNVNKATCLLALIVVYVLTFIELLSKNKFNNQCQWLEDNYFGLFLINLLKEINDPLLIRP